MTKIDFTPMLVSLKLSFWTTLLLFLIAFPVALFLSFRKSKLTALLEPLITLPLVLPPAVIGFYVLLLLSPRNFPGAFFDKFLDIRFVFRFSGILIASLIYSFPFMVQPLKNGIESINPQLLEASYILGKSRLETLLKIIIPNIKPYILTGAVMTFAHTMGEFGVILIVGGNIPGKTKVASIFIYESVEVLNYTTAHVYSLIMLCLSFLILLTVNLAGRGSVNRSPGRRKER